MAVSPPSDAKPYHHGALRHALLAAAEARLAQAGPDSLTLRAIARDVGASHTAPRNHFDDLTGLLSELAAMGFERFARHLLAAAADQPTAMARLNATGRAYVEFALAHPGLFQLMFRGERLDVTRPALRDAMARAYLVLQEAVAAAHPSDAEEMSARVARAWSMAHGFAMLLLDDQLGPLLGDQAGAAGAMRLLDTILAIR